MGVEGFGCTERTRSAAHTPIEAMRGGSVAPNTSAPTPLPASVPRP